MSRQAHNWLIIGGAGSGKTHYLSEVIASYWPEDARKRRAKHLVIINSTSQLSEFCAHTEFVDLEKLKNVYSVDGIEKLIRFHKSVHFEIAPGDAEAFLDVIGQACMRIGKMGTTDLELLLVMDEARHWVKKGKMPPGLERIEAEGRKFGVDPIKATQRLGSTGGDTIDLAAVAQITRLVVLPMAELNQRKRVMEMFGEIPDPATLQRPDPVKGWGGEYVVYDTLTGEGIKVVRNPDGSRVTEELRKVAA
jgi:hypothetical protein